GVSYGRRSHVGTVGSAKVAPPCEPAHGRGFSCADSEPENPDGSPGPTARIGGLGSGGLVSCAHSCGMDCGWRLSWPRPRAAGPGRGDTYSRRSTFPGPWRPWLLASTALARSSGNSTVHTASWTAAGCSRRSTCRGPPKPPPGASTTEARSSGTPPVTL